MLTTTRRLFAVLFIAFFALSPSLAEARAGSSIGSGGSSSFSSMGSMGSRTYGGLSGGAPVQRSLTPNAPSYGTNPGYTQPGYAYPRNSFMSGLGAGLFGAWIGSMLFGHSSYGYGYDGMQSHGGGFFGTLIMLLLFFWVGRMIWRRMSGWGTGVAPMTGPSFFSAAGQAQLNGGGHGSVPRSAQPALALSDGDLNGFTAILSNVQSAWSNGDLNAMRRYVTSEMLSYFSDELSSNTSRGYVNRVSNISLLKGEPRETWSEGSIDYATTYLQWSAVDYNERLDHPGVIVAGDPQRPVVAEEIWTFRRASGGHWLLSAIQQMR